jgi:hypothetical protein
MHRSLCAAISPTIGRADFARFDETFRVPGAAALIEKNASVMDGLRALTSAPPQTKVASRVARQDVVQVRPDGYGYIIKTSAAPTGVAPVETKVSAQKARQILPQEALQVADQQGAATVTGVEAMPDPLTEQATPVTTFGLYKVTNAETGKQLMGYVIPGLFDPLQGQVTGQMLFTNGTSYSMQPGITGVMVGVSHSLPIPENPDIRGLGVFVKTDGKTLLCTVPYLIATKVQVNGQGYFAAQDMMGNDVRIIPSPGLARPVASSATDIAIPADFGFMPLENPVSLAGGEDLMKAAQATAHDTMVEIRAWSGGCSLSGPVFEKVGSGEHSWVDGVFWLAAAGMPQNLSAACLEKAAASGKPVRMYGLQPLSTREELVSETRKEAALDLLEEQLPPRVNLLLEIAAITHDKKASAMIDVASVDAVLALNFLNPENVDTFIEFLPDLENAATKLAGVVLAAQVGLQSIPKTAAVRAMFALEDVIKGLKTLKTYQA